MRGYDYDEIKAAQDDYKEELNQDEREMYRQISKKKRNKTGIREAIKQGLESEVVTEDGITLSVYDKIAIGTIKNALDHPTTGKTLELMKIAGEYTDKQEIKVSNLEEIMNTIKGEEQY